MTFASNPSATLVGASASTLTLKGATATVTTPSWPVSTGLLGSGRAASHQPETRRLRTGPDLPKTHPGGSFDGTRGPISPGTTGRTGPTVVRMMQLRGGERRIRPLLQSKGPDRASAPAGRRIVVCGPQKASRPIAAFLDARRGIIRIKRDLSKDYSPLAVFAFRVLVAN